MGYRPKTAVDLNRTSASHSRKFCGQIMSELLIIKDLIARLRSLHPRMKHYRFFQKLETSAMASNQ